MVMPRNYHSFEWTNAMKRDVDASLPGAWTGASAGRKFNRGCTPMHADKNGADSTGRRHSPGGQNSTVHPR